MNNMEPEGICDVQMVNDGEASPPQSLQIRNILCTVRWGGQLLGQLVALGGGAHLLIHSQCLVCFVD
jgi:hypothetical protein